MTLFFLTFITLYGGMHLYAYRRIMAVTRPGLLMQLMFAFMTVAPLLVRWAEHYGNDRLAFFIAWPAFVWMGALFLFCTTMLVFDLVRGICWFASRTSYAQPVGFLSAATTCKAALFLATLASLYSLYEVRHIRTERMVMRAKPASTNRKPLRIVQISDLHLGLLMNEGRLEGIVKTIIAAHPDILVSTGDLVDGRLSRQESRQKQEKLAAMIKNVPTPLGKYSIPGNHEYYAGIDDALSLTASAGFRMLRNETVILPSGITISGVDDPAANRMGHRVPGNEPAIIKQLSAAPFHLLLKHRPLLQQDSDGTIDLQLSGHTHKGQLLPFYPLTWFNFPIHSGTTITAKGTTVHVSRGTGTWGPPLRFLAPPEVTIIDILP